MFAKKLLLTAIIAAICMVVRVGNVSAAGYYHLTVEHGDSCDVDKSHEGSGLSGGAEADSGETSISGFCRASATTDAEADRAMSTEAYGWTVYEWEWIPDPQNPDEIPPGGILSVYVSVSGETASGGHCTSESPKGGSASGSGSASFSCSISSSDSSCDGSALPDGDVSSYLSGSGTENFYVFEYEEDIDDNGWSNKYYWYDWYDDEAFIMAGTTSFGVYFSASCDADASIGYEEGESCLGQGLGDISAYFGASFSSY